MPATAAAQSSIYHPDADSRSFFTSAGGWAGTTDDAGLCIAPLICPTVTNEFVNSGGTFGDGDGYLSTSITALTGVANTSRGIWVSPPFNYQGAEGLQPTDLVLSYANAADVEALLSVAGNRVDTTIELVDESFGGLATRVIDKRAVAQTDSWVRSPLAELNPAELTLGHNYRIRVITRFAYGAEVLPGGSVDYDDVVLVALRDGAGGPDGPGGPDEAPGPGQAIFDGRNLFFKLKCQGVKRKGKCHVRAVALKSRQGKTRFTFPIQRKVRKGGKVVRARVRFQFRRKLERQRKVVLRSAIRKTRKGPKVVKYRNLRLIKRGA